MLRLDDKQIHWENKFRTIAFSILKTSAPQIVSEGVQFVNRDWWTLNFFVDEFCKYAVNNKTLTYQNVQNLVETVHKNPKPQPRQIRIANIPNEAKPDFISGVIGGIYHECAHTLYTHRSPLNPNTLWDILEPRWGELDNWGLLSKQILHWYNIIEDIRIERNLLIAYPNLHPHMEDLQDFILRLETKDPCKIKSTHALNGTFRDLGLGYDTTLQNWVLEEYKKQQPEAVEFTLTILKPVLDKAIALSDKDSYGAFVLALDAVIAIVKEFGLDNIQEALNVKGSLMVMANTQKGEGDAEKGQGGKGNKGDRKVEVASGEEGEPSEQGEGSDPGEGSDKEGLLLQLVGEGFLTQPEGFKNIHDILNEGIQALTATKPTIKGSQKFRPLSTNKDIYTVVEKGDASVAKRLLEPIYSECSYFRSKIAQVIKAQEQTYTYHGLPKGLDLSEGLLVETFLDLKNNTEPRRAFYDKEDQLDTSMAVFVVLDQSSSMRSWVKEAGTICMAILEPLDRLGVPTACIGLYDEGYDNADDVFHRTNAIHFYIYKDFQERFASALTRFNKIEVNNTTPLADGIELGLVALAKRKEKHKFIFVVTDGQPNFSHGKVMLDQFDIAKKLNIHMVGVGMGECAKYVSTFFPDHVWDSFLGNIPRKLSEKISDLITKKVLKKT